MANVTSGRVSKGVFVMKGKQKQVNRTTLIDSKDTVDHERHQLCQDLLEKVNENIEFMQSDLNAKIFDDLVGYVGSRYDDSRTCEKAYKTKNSLKEIPTAALVTGVNTSDHAAMFSNLKLLLHKKVTSHVAILKSKDCSNLRAIMNTCVKQIMNRAVIDEDDDVEVNTRQSHHMTGSLTILENWYEEMTSVKPSPTKSPKRSPSKHNIDGSIKTRKRSPIVFVLEDLECFPPHILQDFITICSHHIPKLPIVFVFGIATTVTAIHRLLPQHISSVLCIEKFQAPPSTEYLSQVVQQIVMTPEMPFKLGGKVFNVLMDLFLYHDFSVLRFVQGFQAAFLDHFHSNPTSIMCVQQSELANQVSDLSSAQLDALRSVSSFRCYVERKPPAEQIKLLEDDNHMRDTTVKLLHNLHQYNHCLIPVLSCLNCLARKLPGQPLGGRNREIYGMVLNHSMSDRPEYIEAMSLLRTLSRDEMVEKLSECILQLNIESSDGELSAIKEELVDFREKFQSVDQLVQSEESEPEEELKQEESKPLPQKFHALKEKLLQMDKKKKKLTGYESLRGKTIDYLDSIFKKYLVCPGVFPLNEIMYYNNAFFIKRHIIGKPRPLLENALTNPHLYLQREDMVNDGIAILPTLPDICIMYKLHQECGRLINLYDWLQAFITIVKAGVENDENSKDTKHPDKVLQARFIRSVSELEFLGFVKSTKRKTDHVARLTWGAC